MARKKSIKPKKKAVNKTGGFNPVPDDRTPTSRLITPRQAAEILFISTRTLSRWSLAFHQSLSETASRKGRKRFFTSTDIQTLQKAQKLLDEGMGIEGAASSLPVIDPEEEQQTALVLSPEHAYQLGQLVTQADGLVREVDRLRTEKEELTYRLERLERQAAWQRQPIWKRLFSPPLEEAGEEERRTRWQKNMLDRFDGENSWRRVQESKPHEQDDNPADTDT
jgi:DNA-binding transcriptional MerR regulator|tara:strand:- start:58 stop:726 length:669 start_codon:yes stop_codon:yes gene_type:complete